jgi:hypothetical protein
MKKRKIDNLIKKEEKIVKREWKNIIFNTIFAILALLIVIFFYENILYTTILLLIITLVGLLKWKSKLATITFFCGFIFGPIAEIIAISFGVWQYSVTNLINVPWWLFILWGDAAVFFFETTKEVKKLGVKDR